MNILFVCSGNICRSPLAEALFRHKISCLSQTLTTEQPPLDIQVQSAGTSAAHGQPIAFAMELILQENGIDPSHHSQRLDWDLLDWAHLILTMTRDQKRLLLSQIPALMPKLFTLNEYVGHRNQLDIAEPDGSDLDSYRRCAAAIEAGCDRLLEKLQRLPQSSPSTP